MNVVLEPAKMHRKPRMKAAAEKSSARSAWGRMAAVVCLSVCLSCLSDGREKSSIRSKYGLKYGTSAAVAL
jgi:hypothetical protein